MHACASIQGVQGACLPLCPPPPPPPHTTYRILLQVSKQHEIGKSLLCTGFG